MEGEGEREELRERLEIKVGKTNFLQLMKEERKRGGEELNKPLLPP